jgi:hypothetical protein
MRVAVKLRLFFVKRLESSEKNQYLSETFGVCPLFFLRKKDMSTSASMTPLPVVLARLQDKGYGKEFVMEQDGAHLTGTGKVYRAKQLTIVKVYRFEGASDPPIGLYCMLYRQTIKRTDTCSVRTSCILTGTNLITMILS